jgi:hypothetical protein
MTFALKLTRWWKSREFPCLGCDQMVDGYGNNCRCPIGNPRPCCGEYETCTRACTIRGEQRAYRELQDTIGGALACSYVYMLQTDGLLRVREQRTFCAVRDAIVKLTGRDTQEVQETHEAIAIGMKKTEPDLSPTVGTRYVKELELRARELRDASGYFLAAIDEQHRRHDLKGDLQMHARSKRTALEDAAYGVTEILELPNVALAANPVLSQDSLLRPAATPPSHDPTRPLTVNKPRADRENLEEFGQ